MKLKDLEKYLAELLEVNKFKDYCPKGLVIEACDEVKKGIAAVSFCYEVAEYAVEQNADFIVVHHPDGFFVNQDKLLVGRLAKSVKLLMKHDISLFGFHLPLDAHPDLGNNAQIAKKLNLDVVAGFGFDGAGNAIGCVAELKTPMFAHDFFEHYKKTIGSYIHCFDFSKNKISKVAICSGASGSSAIDEAYDLGAECLITGEAKESSMAISKELAMSFIAGGHHRTEVFGVQALAEHLESVKNLEMKFYDVKNPV